MNTPVTKITRAEQNDLRNLIKQRAMVAKADAIQRGAQLVADFETQLDAEYSFDRSVVWEAVFENASMIVDDANERVREESNQLGIPPEFAPKIHMGWISQGQQGSQQRKAELRRLASVHIDAQVKLACAAIDRSSVLAQTNLIATGLSEAAQLFLHNMPTIEEMLPTVMIGTIKGLLASTKSNRFREY